MRETSSYARFVEGGEREWRAVGDALARLARTGARGLGHQDLERLAADHRRVVADFAWARSTFPGTPVERRLRELAFEGHRLLAPRDPPIREQVRTWLTETFPQAFADCAPERAVALAVMGGGAVLGLVLGTLDEQAGAWFIGQDSLAALRRGEMWTDHLTSVVPGSTTSGFIARNNMSVALMAWIGGLTGGLASFYVLLLNGVMLGAVVAVCVRYGTLHRLLAFIPAHGVLELYVISIAAASGLRLARGMVVAGPEPRTVTAARGGRVSMAMATGTLPWLLLLGAVEGFVSPLDLPLFVELGIGLSLLLLFLGFARGGR